MVTLYKFVDAEKVETILKEGIPPSQVACKDEPEPRRINAVFAYTLNTVVRIAPLGTEEVPSRIIVFVTPVENWLVGDLYLECQPAYTAGVRSLKDIIEEPILEKRYREMECFLPNGYIKPEQIIAVKKRTDFIYCV